MSGRLRHFLGLALAVTGAACVAASASATPMRPALSSVPFVQISDAAAHAAQQSPICPNGLVCYSPSFIRQAYDFPNGHNATGAGQTIVLVEAYGSQTLRDDLTAFDAEYGIPDPPSFTVLNQQTPVSSAGSGDTFFWAVETSLDVEYAHAMAPGANIVVAVANTDDSLNFLQVEQEVLSLPSYRGAIVSQSFGADETGPCSDPQSFAAMETLYGALVQNGGTVVASAGDYGATNLGPLDEHCPSLAPMAGFPASSPLVLAVGGTEGSPYPGGLWSAPGKYGGEQVWNELTPTVFPGAGATGGAPSVVFAAPPWQQGLTTYSTRTEPDVAYNAAVNGGVIVVLGGRHGVVGGTSAGAPQWAAIVALANELRGKQGRLPLGRATPQLYAIAQDSRSYSEDFHDILTGNNALGAGLPGFPTLPGFSAGPGYDIPTGLGTPDVSKLLKDLSVHESPSLRVDDVARSTNGKHGGHVRLDPRG